MPCYQTGSLAGDQALEAEEARKHVTKLAEMLCEACAILQTHKLMFAISPKTRRWWKQHKKTDQARERVRVRCGECHKTYMTLRGSHQHKHPSHHSRCTAAGR